MKTLRSLWHVTRNSRLAGLARPLATTGRTRAWIARGIFVLALMLGGAALGSLGHTGPGHSPANPRVHAVTISSDSSHPWMYHPAD